jgi:hypothetical protein
MEPTNLTAFPISRSGSLPGDKAGGRRGSYSQKVRSE